MKNLIYSLLFVFTISYANANVNKNSNILKNNSYVEYTIVENSQGATTCYARICWYPSDTTKICSEWVEVPCGATLEIEGTTEN